MPFHHIPFYAHADNQQQPPLSSPLDSIFKGKRRQQTPTTLLSFSFLVVHSSMRTIQGFFPFQQIRDSVKAERTRTYPLLLVLPTPNNPFLFYSCMANLTCTRLPPFIQPFFTPAAHATIDHVFLTYHSFPFPHLNSCMRSVSTSCRSTVQSRLSKRAARSLSNYPQPMSTRAAM